MLISIITCTGHRPEAFALCRAYLGSQTYYGDLQWIVVSDDPSFPKIKPIDKPSFTIEQYKAPKLWTPEYNTHRSNMEFALTKVKGDFVFFMEDDDYYSPDYIDTYLDMLAHTEAVGMVRARYFHIGMPGYKEVNNFTHAALSQTAVTKWALPTIVKAVNSGHMYFDGIFWEEHLKNKRPHIFIGNSKLACGIKCMPGREGISPSHKELSDYFVDPLLEKLKSWIGEDYKPYFEISQRIKNEKRKDTADAKAKVNEALKSPRKQSEEQVASAKDPKEVSKLFTSGSTVSGSDVNSVNKL